MRTFKDYLIEASGVDRIIRDKIINVWNKNQRRFGPQRIDIIYQIIDENKIKTINDLESKNIEKLIEDKLKKKKN